MKDNWQSVYDFWFKELTPQQWYEKNLALDENIKERFLELHKMAHQGELAHWRDNPQAALSEIIILDQFSRNMFRDTPKAFASDPLALSLSQFAIKAGLDKELSVLEKSFLYLPFMHSESLVIHEQAMELYKVPGLEQNLEFEIKHKVIIERFGRYPHRNEILGRTSTDEEIEFLKSPGSSF